MGNLVRDMVLLGYAATVGFVAAGIVASFYRWVTSEPAGFAPLGQGLLAFLTTFAFCALTGPIIVLDRAVQMRRAEKGPVGWVLAGVLIAALWSCCSGIVVLAVVVSLRQVA